MGVSLKQAEEWEASLYPGDPTALVYFAAERTKTWETRLKEYYERRAALAEVEMNADKLLLRYREKKRIGTEFHGFMSLPIILRRTIYKYLLDKGTVFLPNLKSKMSDIPDTKHATYNFATEGLHFPYLRYRGLPGDWRFRDRSVTRPIGLISGVSRSVHEEATTIYFGCNRFVFPYGLCNLPITSCYFDDSDFWHRQFFLEEGYLLPPYALLRCVSFTFDRRNIDLPSYLEVYKGHKQFHKLSGNDNQESEPLQLIVYLMSFHDTMRRNLLESWNTVFYELRALRLERLELSFEECYCPFGCCRLVNEVLERLRLIENPSTVIEITGWYDEKERKMIKERLDKLAEKHDELDFQSVMKEDLDFRFVGKSIKKLMAEYEAKGPPF
ncbi:hypothetical protein F5Y00DRAFT_259706 [Daldinia vernicosa]|uniref:uncharacterized protein n=1 Tax=Daldinia vernicosa TaxID=114800 RepID=UPI002008457B|nr:uncharacterized protein F5Y00DRAFT_259706 [Daldinia vernicosa]KAI0851165.1 hypothetical protein F5Y00DRAFT_259706 [Daldinia vernicosa]